MLKFAIIGLLSSLTLVPLSEGPALAQSSSASKWDGTWSGRSSAGGQTSVTIKGGKVVAWTNNGYPRPKASGSVSGNSVRLDDNNGWKATMSTAGEGRARITAAGIGNNGKPAKNTALLSKR